jgi:hypothetical protein
MMIIRDNENVFCSFVAFSCLNTCIYAEVLAEDTLMTM